MNTIYYTIEGWTCGPMSMTCGMAQGPDLGPSCLQYILSLCVRYGDTWAQTINFIHSRHCQMYFIFRPQDIEITNPDIEDCLKSVQMLRPDSTCPPSSVCNTCVPILSESFKYINTKFGERVLYRPMSRPYFAKF